jgi:hypothetical protein
LGAVLVVRVMLVVLDELGNLVLKAVLPAN